jgi:Na+-driven multidrug efflux pump
MNGLAIVLSLFFGILIVVIGFPVADTIATLMGALAEVHANAVRYIQIRLFGAPAF